MEENEKFTRAKASNPGATDNATFWEQVALQLRLFDGLVDGYSAAAPADQKMGTFDFWILNSMGDMDDLSIALFPQYAEHFTTNADFHSHCTGMIKVLVSHFSLMTDHLLLDREGCARDVQ